MVGTDVSIYLYLVQDCCPLSNCSIRLEAEEAEGLRRLSGTHSDLTRWTGSSLPPPPHPPPTPGSSTGLAKPVFPQAEGGRSPPQHGPLSPVTVPVQDCPVECSTPGSSPTAGSWDNYLERNSYEAGENEFWSAERDIKKIPIVTTDISELGFTSSNSDCSEISDTVFTSELDTMAPSPACNDAAKALVNAKNVLQVRIDLLDPDDFDLAYLHTIPEELDLIRNLLTDFMVKIMNFLDDFKEELDTTVVASWKEESTRAKKLVLDHKKLVWSKCNQLNPVKPLSYYEKQSLQNQAKQLTLQEATVGTTVGAEERRILGVAEVKYEALVESSKKILNVTRDRTAEDLIVEEEENIRKYMRELGDLKLTVERFFSEIKEFKEHTVIHKLSSDKHQNVEYFYLNVEKKFATYVKDLEQQDADRALYTLETAPGEKVKWPKFSGEIEENFSKFKEKFEHAARLNRTSRTVQLAKLRECLSGYPLTLVPETTLDITEAFSKLTQLYGNVSRVLAFQKKKLSGLGLFPSDTDADSPRKKMQWLMDISEIIQEYIKIGDSGDSRMFCEAFSVSSVGQFINAFPQSMAEKLTSIECDGDGRDQLEGLLAKVDQMRMKAQRVDIHNSLNPRPTQTPSGKKVHLAGWDKQKKELLQQMNSKPPGKAYIEISDVNLRIHKNCKICINAKTSDPAVDFSNHLGIWTTGCPIFNKMDTEQRADVASALVICHRCLNPTKRIIDKRKMICGSCRPHKFTCKHMGKSEETRCLLHVWTCSSHKNQPGNKEVIRDFNKVWKSKTGELVVMVTQADGQAGAQAAPQAAPQADPQADPFIEGQTEPSQPKVLKSLSLNSNPTHLAQAARRLRRNEKKRNPEAEFVPVPDGQALFIFCPVEGRTRDLNFFKDSGCSSALFKSGIPGKELHGQIVEKGPFVIQGVNGVKIMAGDEWLVQLYRTDGRIQFMKGLTLDVITADFPKISTAQAVLEVKNDNPECAELQACKVPDLAGGSVDGLIGILYNAIFPVPVHTLPSGLTIYKTRLKSKNNKYNATIGGPHSTFEYLAGELGGAAALLTIFRQGLEKYHKLGPPKLKAAPLTVEEIAFNTAYKSAEGDKEIQELEILEKLEEAIMNKYDDGDPDVQQHILPNPPDTLLICECGIMCDSLKESSIKLTANISEDERIKDLNSLKLQLEEGGLEISYRCIRCRDCNDCKNAAKTEHLSLREEAEMELIKKSVVLDFKNKRIICSLPLRGEEQEFLTTNRDRALKVLEQQCRKYFKDQPTKELILKAFKKLFDNGHAGPVHELSDQEREAFSNKPVSYYIPWRVVFSESLSTPCRSVLDGSSRTRKRLDGTGGRCLNDLVAKGKIETINLVKMLLRFCVGIFAFCGDLQQFYNSCKLQAEYWNLQRFLWKEDIDPDAEAIEMVMKTLIYGVKCVSAQSEEAKLKLAEAVKTMFPDVYHLILNAIYVDDIGESKSTKEECEKVMENADKTFDMVNLHVKGWSVKGSEPSDTVSKDGITVGIGGFGWNPFLDSLEIKIPGLHFGKKIRGRLSKTTEIFSGGFEDLDKFVPKNLSRRQVASKYASIFDVLGKFGPILIGAKIDLRATFKVTEDWDSAMPADLRHRWIKNFWKWEQLRGIQFSRAVMPEDAASCKMRLTAAVDAAEEAIVVGVWAGFQRKNGEYSCQHLISRTILTAENSSIPKSELEALTGGSNLCWIVRDWLADWVDSYILVGDSTISLFWVSSEHKRLSLFHRNRVLQILRGSSLANLFHVKTDYNPSDLGTRPKKVTLEQVNPASKWICGEEWMTWSVEKAVAEEILKPVSELRMKKEEEEVFNEGCVFDKEPEVLTRGHLVNEKRVAKLEQRAAFSEYLILPTKFGFRKLVRVYSYILSFYNKLKQGAKRRRPDLFTSEPKEKLSFSIFYATQAQAAISTDSDLLQSEQTHSEQPQQVLLGYFGVFVLTESSTDRFTLTQTNRNDAIPVASDKYISLALCYLFRKATLEVKKFNNKATLDKMAVETEGVLFSTGRFLQGMRFIEAGGLEAGDLGSLSINARAPVLDRHSPLTYCIAQHVHWRLAVHRGPETCYRTSLQYCYILQGLPLFTELQDECIRCKKIRKKYMQQLMSPLSEHQLTVAPPHWATQMDLFGPVTLYVPGRERQTRNNPCMTYKAWVLVLICPVTKLSNIQVCESSDASGILDALTRMFCEAGVPKVLLCDEDSAVVKALREVEMDIRNLEHQLITEYSASFKIVPVSGHNMNGLVERAIRTIQDSLEESGLKKTRLNATGLQTFCKLVENQCNNLPLGFKRSRDADNSELFRILTPNMLRHGRINSRSLEGPVRLPGSLSEMAQRVTDVFWAWFKIWSTVAVPKLAQRTKWFRPDRNLEVGDIVYFQKDTSGLNTHWTTGMVDEVAVGTDNLVREVVIRYRNYSEEFDRFTSRAVRSCVRLHNMDDNNLADDLHELTERLSRVEGGEQLAGLLSKDGDDKSKQDGSDQSELPLNLSQLTTQLQPSPACNATNQLSSVTGTPTKDILGDGGAILAGGRHQLLLTPRSRSPVGQSREDEETLARALLTQSVPTPVIVCDESSVHTPQAQSCLTTTARPLLSTTSAKSTNPTSVPSLSLTSAPSLPITSVPPSLPITSTPSLPITSSTSLPITSTTSLPITSAPPSLPITSATTLPSTPATSKTVGRLAPPALPGNQLPAKCNKCCCVGHHKFAHHKVQNGVVPGLACDLGDLKLTFSDREVGLNGPEKFASLNQMIWSCQLSLMK